jgi:SAM-dependent methyltransferase
MDAQEADALARWREQLDGWAIPEEILAAAPESPWAFPVGLFRSRARRAGSRPATPSNREAARSLPPGGSVLDVGAGGGAASLPLAGVAGRLVAVDESADMVAAFLAAAEAAGVPASGVEGRWPEVAGRVAPADVVVCHHVLYNVADLAPFADALTGHARRRVVAELTERHPLVGLAPLWRRFHGLERPSGPGADDAVAARTGRARTASASTTSTSWSPSPGAGCACPPNATPRWPRPCWRRAPARSTGSG